jgi:hypothetical protein
MDQFSFKKVCFNLSSRGMGSYVEILDNWTLDDYEIFLQTLEEGQVKNG